MRRRLLPVLPVILLAFILNGAPAANSQSLVFAPEAIEWNDAPPSLPPGAKVAVLRGDPTQPGLFTMRLQFPANYIVPPHWHTADEHVTVVSGALRLGMGEKFDRTKGRALSVGTLMVMPATMRHFAWFEQETVLQLHGIGPWMVNYVNPEDDPRKQ